MGGRERRGSCTNNDTETVLKLYQDPNVLRKVQGLNAQAKGEVQILISGRGRAIQAKGEVIISGRGAIELHILRQLHGEAGTWWYQGVVRTSGADLGLEHSVVVLRTVRRWPAFDPLFFSGGEAQFRDQDNSVVLIAPNISPVLIFL